MAQTAAISSHETLALRAGAQRLLLAPDWGGRVLRFGTETRDWFHPITATTFNPLDWPRGGCYPLAPYSNRIANARFTFDGRAINQPVHPGAPPHTLHGESHTRPWRVTESGGDRATLVHDSHGAPWPWRFRVTQRFALAPDGLTITIEIDNRDKTPIPCGFGLHPYFAGRAGAKIAFQAARAYPPTEDFLSGPGVSTPREWDFTSPRAMPEGAVTMYYGGWDGRARYQRADGIVLDLEAQNLPHLVLHSPAGGAFVCLEPTSHMPDAMNRPHEPGNGWIVLAPGEARAGALAITIRNPT